MKPKRNNVHRIGSTSRVASSTIAPDSLMVKRWGGFAKSGRLLGCIARRLAYQRLSRSWSPARNSSASASASFVWSVDCSPGSHAPRTLDTVPLIALTKSLSCDSARLFASFTVCTTSRAIEPGTAGSFAIESGTANSCGPNAAATARSSSPCLARATTLRIRRFATATNRLSGTSTEFHTAESKHLATATSRPTHLAASVGESPAACRPRSSGSSAVTPNGLPSPRYRLPPIVHALCQRKLTPFEIRIFVREAQLLFGTGHDLEEYAQIVIAGVAPGESVPGELAHLQPSLVGITNLTPPPFAHLGPPRNRS